MSFPECGEGLWRIAQIPGEYVELTGEQLTVGQFSAGVCISQTWQDLGIAVLVAGLVLLVMVIAFSVADWGR